MVNSSGVSGDFTLRNAIRDVRGRQYTSFFNSSKNSRGTAILLASEIGFTVNKIFRDQDENILILDVSLKNSHFLSGSTVFMDLTIHAEGFIISFGIYSSVNQITRLFSAEIGTRCGIEQLLSITSTFLACPLCLMRKMASIWRASVWTSI